MTRVPQDPLRPGRTRRKWPMVDSIQGYNISKNCDDASPRFFCEARFNMRILRFFGLIQRDLSGPLRPGKISGHGLLQYSFQSTIYAKSVMTQVLVILGGFSENRLFGTYQILWMSYLGGLTLVPYGLPAPNGDTKLLIWPIPLIYVKTAMTQVLDFVLRPNCTFACWFLL